MSFSQPFPLFQSHQPTCCCTNPQLKVTRYQFPIAPDFADTFYGAQGSTIEPGVIVDMVGADPIAAYIGMTRCRTRQKILIYRPFPLAPFQAGLPLGRQLLLDVWKQGLRCIAQEVLGRKTLSRVWGDETQRRVHQSTMETGNIPRL